MNFCSSDHHFMTREDGQEKVLSNPSKSKEHITKAIKRIIEKGGRSGGVKLVFMLYKSL